MKNNSAIIIDPAESDKILDILKKKKLNLDYIFITHHHSDHTSGVVDLVKAYPEVKVFSPSELNSISVNIISDGNEITTNFNKFKLYILLDILLIMLFCVIMKITYYLLAMFFFD